VTAALTRDDLVFINRVAARRFAGAEPLAPDAAVLDSAVAAGGAGTAVASATRLVATLLTSPAFPTVPEHSALLALHCSLALRGLSLLAPQGVLVGMIRALAGGGDPSAFERWLQDRTVPSTSEG
jgi:hypothetical protein